MRGSRACVSVYANYLIVGGGAGAALWLDAINLADHPRIIQRRRLRDAGSGGQGLTPANCLVDTRNYDQHLVVVVIFSLTFSLLYYVEGAFILRYA